MNAANDKWREGMLEHLRANVRLYSDCTEAGKPIYHSLERLAQGMRGYTGYLNSTPLESWSEQKRLNRWYALKAGAVRSLRHFENGCKRKITRHTAGARERAVKLFAQAGERGLTARELQEQLYGQLDTKDCPTHRASQLIADLRRAGNLEVIRQEGGKRRYVWKGAEEADEAGLHQRDVIFEPDRGRTDEAELHQRDVIFEPDLIGLS